MRFLRRGLLAAGALAVIVVAFASGAAVDQAYPEYVPALHLGGFGRSQTDRAVVNQAMQVIDAHYYDPHVDSRKLAAAGVGAIVQALGDPYSEYLSPAQYQQQQDLYASRHNGMIGIYVNFAGGYPVIVGVLPGSPALRARLQTGDVIVRIDGTDAHDLKADRASALIRGPAGSSVTLRVSRAGVEQDVPVTRANFQSPTVQSARLDGDILYVRIYQFGDTTQGEFDAQLRAGLPGARGVVLDLRDNGGGFVSAAAAVISRFVAGGEAFEERGRDGRVDRTDVDGDHPAAAVPLVVLVNDSSASASEIVAGSLQARGRARLVGTRTFGKGSVQVDYRLDDGGDIHLTVGHWYLPSGRSIEKQGLTPDATVPLSDRAAMYDVVQPARGSAADTQLAKAVALLTGQ